MTRLALCLPLLFILVGCKPSCWSSDPAQCRLEMERASNVDAEEKLKTPFQGTTVDHDDARGVTCWTRSAGTAIGLSCLPDWMLRSDMQAGNERQLSPHETQPEPTPALAHGRWIDERYEL
ncbi:hypothetical protein Q7C30_000185 [Pseudomonas sp. RAC1]|uniref:hypothetical protein n=1 Tax=Pseudomonas sp. RAC1 TaxID=3064900 RepID=UPI0027181171|nr:hypothetical protein [Pseudomonas sp. RAC1]MDV9030521.1 hypothetical protein [Pseudomonas sp. RAC1]